jgi:AAA domain
MLARNKTIQEAFDRIGALPEPPLDNRPTASEIPDGADGEPDYEPEPAVGAPAGLPPLTVADWGLRDLPAPDFVIGNCISTTTRWLLSAETGIGKSLFLNALGQHAAAGLPFLHWDAPRSVKTLYVDGEMSRRLLKERIFGEANRHSGNLDKFYVLSREDLEGFQPLNLPAGQAWMLGLIKHLGIELVIFDNIMCLTLGDQKDPLVWQQTLPFVLELTRRNVGQIWVHHTGHDTTKGYGDKSREWQLDTTAVLEKVERPDTDVSFTLSFHKARERTPATRRDFQDVTVALVNDRWEGSLEGRRASRDTIRPAVQKALEALINVLAGDQAVTLPGNRRAAHRDHWATECNDRGLIDLSGKAVSARTLMNTFRRELVAANCIACEGEMQWLR